MRGRRILILVLRVMALVYLGLCGLLYFGQQSLLYFPDQLTVEAGEKTAGALGWKPWLNPEGGSFGWQAQSPGKVDAPRWVLFHGNGGNAFYQHQIVQALQEETATREHGIYLVEYPGYGSQPGHPSEKELLRLSSAAVQSLQGAGPVYLVGESLGTGVVCGVARRQPSVTGLLLLMPFNRLTAVAGAHYPFFPTQWILQDRFDSSAGLGSYPGSVVVVTGGVDPVVPARFGRQLYDNFKGRKWYWEEAEAGHNVAEHSHRVRWWSEAIQFLLHPS
jgi:pimeloyl-ACP methyl ester carboxylesterase